MMVREGDGILEEEEKTKHLLSKAEISILLDTYDDIFSDFDPRPYGQRALSDDFLVEAKKAVKSAGENQDTFDLSFMIPRNVRRMDYELVIRRRLREHFRKHFSIVEKEINQIKWEGIRMVILGIILMFSGAAIHFYFTERLITSFLVILLEPAGWFTFWEGLNRYLFEYRPKQPELEFYQKMSKCEISFHTY